MELFGIDWSYFSLWKDGFLDDFTAQQVQALLNDADIVTEDELPLLPWSAVDYNRDGDVSAADYVVWRKMDGQSGMNLPADGDLNDQVNAADYIIWRENFGRAVFEPSDSGASGSPSVPEPSSHLLLIAVTLWLLLTHAKARRRKDKRTFESSGLSAFA
jgi:hypothetical protein